MLLVLALSLLLSVAGFASAYNTLARYPPGCEGDACVVHAQWSVVGSDLQLTMTGRTGGYITVAWADTPRMHNMDIISGIMQGGTTALVQNRFVAGYDGPGVDQPDVGAISGVSGNKTGNFISFTFTRSLVTSGSPSVDFDLSGNNEYYIFFVIGGVEHGDGLEEHTGDGTPNGPLVTDGKFSMSATGELVLIPCSNTRAAKVHALLMWLAWIFFSPAGTFFSRYLKHVGPMWFNVHAAFQIIALILSIISLVALKLMRSGEINAGDHKAPGILLMVLAGIQCIMGIFRNTISGFSAAKNKENPSNRGSRRWLFVNVHKILGYACIPISIATLWTGMDQIGEGKNGYIPLYIFIALAVLAVLYYEGKEQWLLYKLNNPDKFPPETPKPRKKGWDHVGTVVIVVTLALACAASALTFTETI